MSISKTLIVATISLLSLPAMAGYGTVSEGLGLCTRRLASGL